MDGMDGSVKVGGNTILQPSNRSSQRKRWCFTWNNYPENYLDFFNGRNGRNILKFCIGEEIAPETGTPHLQGYLEMEKPSRPSDFFGKDWNKLHWETAKGDEVANYKYCSKGEGKFTVRGIFKLPVKLKLLDPASFYPWQSKLAKEVEEEPDDRTIIWIWEQFGCVGKSAFCKWLCAEKGAIICSGKASDMKFQLMKMDIKPNIVIFDVPRSNLEYVSYTGIEEIKNGCFSSSKYESGMVLMNSPHLIVFANERPETSKMSADRWDIRIINNTTKDFDEVTSAFL